MKGTPMKSIPLVILGAVSLVILGSTLTLAQQTQKAAPNPWCIQECINTEFYVEGVHDASLNVENAHLIYDLAGHAVKNAEHIKSEADAALTKAGGLWTSKDELKAAEDRAKAANDQLKQANELYKRAQDNWTRAIENMSTRNKALERQIKRVEKPTQDAAN